MGIDFTPSRGCTVGMELEYQLLDGDTLDLVDGVLPLMEFCGPSEYIKPEAIQSTIQLISPICADVAELESHFNALLAGVKNRADKLGMCLCGAGTHPFSKKLAAVTPLPRYRAIEQTYGLVALILVTYGTHVHIGVGSGDEAMTLMRELKSYLPVLIALSANSPYWRGYDSGFEAFRHRMLAIARSYGIPPSFDNWEAFSAFYDSMRRAGLLATIDDLHWDIRPQPNLGTVEIRVMDAQASLQQSLSLAGLLRALSFYLLATPPAQRSALLPRPLPWWMEKENHFQATRGALGARYVRDQQGSVCNLSDVARAVLESILPSAGDLGEARWIRPWLEGPPISGAVRQRQVYAECGSMRAVVQELVDRL